MSQVAPDPKLSASKSFVTLKENMTVARLLLEYLKLEGVGKIFGVPGGALIFLLDEMKKQSDCFDFVVCRQETGAAYIADGYARVTGNLGVVMTTAGPSATNALTGSMNAQASNSPLLTITGEVPQEYFGQGYLQEGIDARLNIDAIYRNAVQYSTVISSPVNFATLFQQALRDARSRPPRATHVSLPNNIAGSCVLPKGGLNKIAFPNAPERYRALPSGTDPKKVEAALARLTEARRPLIFLGNGSREALGSDERLAAFTRFVERFAIPVMTTPDAKGIFPESHELSLRNYGMTACAWPGLYMQPRQESDHYDALLVLGSTLGELATSVVATDHYSKMLIPKDHFIQVDLAQGVIGRDFPVTLGIVAEIGATIDLLAERGAARKPDQGAVDERRKLIAELKASTPPFHDPKGRDSDAAPLNPAALVRIMNEEVSDGHIFIDAGNCVGWSLNNMVVDPPLRYHSALGMGPMGFAVGAVVGGKMGAPDKTCVALVGDGAFMMQGTEVSTAAQNGVGAIWVVLWDNDLAMVSQGMAALFPPPNPWQDYYKLGHPDLAKVAEGLGADAAVVTRKEGGPEFRSALHEAIERADKDAKPQVIVAHIDTGAMPPYGWPSIPKPDCSGN